MLRDVLDGMPHLIMRPTLTFNPCLYHLASVYSLLGKSLDQGSAQYNMKN